jgi:nucleolar protein 56
MKKFWKYYRKNLAETKKKLSKSVKEDDLIISAANNIKSVNKAANTLSKSLRNWCELYCPEFSKSLSDNKRFAELVLEKDKKHLLESIGVKEEQSMGAFFGEKDTKPMQELAREIVGLFRLKEKQSAYLESLMEKKCPNISAVAGPMIGAKLIVLAGSLEKLAMLPASATQVLGAERALFRHLRNKKSKPPKHGILYEHPLISSAKKEMHGKIARALADKISIAARLDYFKGEFRGEKLREALEKKFR